MPDDKSKPIPRIEISDYAAMGRKVLEWAEASPEDRPRTVDQLKIELENIATVPDRIKELEFVQSTLEKLVLRLPPLEMAQEGLERVGNLEPNGDYREPRFYKDKILSGEVGNLEFFFSRVGDYTIAQCM